MNNWLEPLLRKTLRPLLMATLMAIWATAHGQNCTFVSVASSLNFPALDPSTGTTVTTFMDIQVRCIPASITPTWQFSGANGNTPLRMKHATQNAYIPYTISTTSLGGGSTQTWRFTGMVLGANYQNAQVGSYTDILSATVLP